MFLFVLSYPLLLFLCFLSLRMIRIKDMVDTLTHIWKYYIVVWPFIALLLRMLRVSAVDTLGLRLGFNQFIYLVVVPLALFLFIYFVNRIRLQRVLIRDSKESSPYYRSIIIISITNELLITLLQLLMNYTFFHWIDIVVLPLLRMSLAQIYICLAILVEKSFASASAVQERRKCLLSRLAIVIPLVIIVGIISAIAIVYITRAQYYWGGITVVIIFGLGIIATMYLGITREQPVEVA